MHRIAIISSSVRFRRNSHRVATYLEHFINENALAETDLLDLHEFHFPLFEERLKFQMEPAENVVAFAERFKKADGILIVTPEYNGGYPAALKNVVDLFVEEWHHKPVAISTVSAGAFGGSQVITSLQFSLWKLKALMAPAVFPIAKVSEAFNEKGEPSDKAGTDKRAKSFVDELLWCIEAKKKMEG